MFDSRICWYLIESPLPSTSEMFPMPLAATQAQSMIDPPPCWGVGGVLFIKLCTLLYPQKALLIDSLPGSSILSSSVHRTFSKMHQTCVDVNLQTPDAQLCGKDTGKVFLLMTLP